MNENEIQRTKIPCGTNGIKSKAKKKHTSLKKKPQSRINERN